MDWGPILIRRKSWGGSLSGDRPGGTLERLFLEPTRPALPATAAAASSPPMTTAASAPPTGSAGTRESMRVGGCGTVGARQSGAGAWTGGRDSMLGAFIRTNDVCRGSVPLSKKKKEVPLQEEKTERRGAAGGWIERRGLLVALVARGAEAWRRW